MLVNSLKKRRLFLPKKRHWQIHNNLVIENLLLKKMLGMYDNNLKIVAAGLDNIKEQIQKL